MSNGRRGNDLVCKNHLDKNAIRDKLSPGWNRHDNAARHDRPFSDQVFLTLPESFQREDPSSHSKLFSFVDLPNVVGPTFFAIANNQFVFENMLLPSSERRRIAGWRGLEPPVSFPKGFPKGYWKVSEGCLSIFLTATPSGFSLEGCPKVP